MRSEQALATPGEMAAVYRAEMRRLLDAVDRIPAERLGEPIHDDWTIREVLVHLAGWDRAIAASADDVAAGGTAALTRMRLEDVNEGLVDAHRGDTVEEARRELEAAHLALLDRVEAIAPERWGEAVRGAQWKDGSPMTLASVFAYRYHGLTHYGGHAAEIEEWLAGG